MPEPSFFSSIINNYLPEPQSSLLNGILFGLPIPKSSPIYEEFKKLGLLHIVVLSGMNITILAGFISILTVNLGKKISVLLVILSVIIFIGFVHPQAPSVRAGIMGILTFVAIYLGRKTVGLYSLILSAIFIAIVWPQWFSSISLYLSYAATLGMLLFASFSTNVNNKSQSHGILNSILSFISMDIRTSISAQIFTTPLILIYFKQISIIAPLSNLFISFVIPPLMLFGFLTAILGKIHFLLGLPFAYASYGLTTYILLVTEFLSKIPFIFFDFSAKAV